MSRNIDDLRESLFDALQMLKSGRLDVEKAKAISEMSQVIINTAKVEVDFIRANNGGDSRFLGARAEEEKLPPGITGVRRHRIKG